MIDSEGMLHLGARLCMPNVDELRKEIMEEVHWYESYGGNSTSNSINDMNHMDTIQPTIQLIVRMDQKEHIEDIGSHEDKIKLDGLYLNHEVNVLNDVL